MLRKLYNKSRLSPYIIISILTVLTTLMLWAPFLLKVPSINGIPDPEAQIETHPINFEVVLKHWDGPLYVIPAKTAYSPSHEIMQNRPLGLSPQYFAAHLPLYPLTIAFLAPFVGFIKGTVVSTLLSSIALMCAFYYIVKRLKLSQNPLLLTFVFMFITPRFFVVRSIGSPEPLFLLTILGSLFFFIKRRYWLAGLVGALGIATKTPAGLLFIAYCVYFAHEYISTRKFNVNWLGVLLIPAGFFVVSLLYMAQYGDFFAYFNSGDNLHLLIPPFQVFNFQKLWVSSAWLEDILFIYFFYGLAISELYTREKGKDFHSADRIFLYFMAIFFAAIICVQHRDIARYSLPLLPIALITFEKFFTSRRFIVVLLLIVPAIYAYAWNFMMYNIAPVTDWVPFM